MSKQESTELVDHFESTILDGDGAIDWHEFADVLQQAQEQVRGVNDDDFCIKSDEFCISNDELLH